MNLPFEVCFFVSNVLFEREVVELIISPPYESCQLEKVPGLVLVPDFVSEAEAGMLCFVLRTLRFCLCHLHVRLGNVLHHHRHHT